MKRLNNRGMSLMELITVIGIMAVMVGFISLSVGIVFGTQAQECAQNVSARINSTKTGCMSRYDEVMMLRYLNKNEVAAAESKGIYSDNYITTISISGNDVKKRPVSDPDTRKMGDASVKVTVFLEGEDEGYILKHEPVSGDALEANECSHIVIRFDRNTGAMKTVGLFSATDDTGKYLDRITFQYGMRTYEIKFIKETGKHTISRI